MQDTTSKQKIESHRYILQSCKTFSRECGFADRKKTSPSSVTQPEPPRTGLQLPLSAHLVKLSSLLDEIVPSKKRKIADSEDTEHSLMSSENGSSKPSDYYDRYSRQHYVLGEHAMRFVVFC